MSEALIVVGVIIGSAMTLLTTYTNRRWIRQDAVESERRQVRLAERRSTVVPLRSFMDAAAKATGRRSVQSGLMQAYDDDVGGIQHSMTRERLRDLLARGLVEGPSELQLTQDYVAATAAAPNREIVFQLFVIWAWAQEQEEPGAVGKFRDAIERARQLVEDYVVSAIGD